MTSQDRTRQLKGYIAAFYLILFGVNCTPCAAFTSSSLKKCHSGLPENKAPHRFLIRQHGQRNLFVGSENGVYSMTPKTRPVVYMASNDENDKPGNTNSEDSDILSETSLSSSSSDTFQRSSKRVGGRSKASKSEKKEDGTKKFVLPAAIAAAVLAIFTIFSRLFLPGPASNPNFVYYSSSVYETRNYDAATGKMITNRQENFKSNIPGLKGQFSERPDKGITPSGADRLTPSTSSSTLTLRPQTAFSVPTEDYDDVNISMDDLDAAINKEMVRMFEDFWN